VIYIHETTRIIPGRLERFVERFERAYLPDMQAVGARLVGIWETVAISLPSPQAIVLWEIDDLGHYSKVAKAQYQDPKYAPRFRAWRSEQGELSSGSVGRILMPAPGSPTLAQMRSEGIDASVCVHEWLVTQPDKQFDYAEQIARLWVPFAKRNGRRWIGTWTTQWKNFEALSIWAYDEGFDAFGAHYQQKLDKTPTEQDRAELNGWMAIAIALRERYDDGLIHALPPTPLRK
jgi:hypothetical protein